MKVRGIRVLIVARSEDDAARTVHALRRGGFDPTSRRVGSESEMSDALGQGGQWDVVLADDSVPGFAGLDAAACLKSRGIGIPLVLVSDVAGASAPAAGQAGADGCVDRNDPAGIVPAVLLAARGQDAQSPGADAEELDWFQAELLQAQKMEAAGRLAGGVAHDFRNQLTVIRGYCDILLRQLPLDDASRDPIEEIRAAAERSAALTSQLLAFSRKQILSPCVLDIEEIIGDMAESLARVLGEDITISVVTSDANTHVFVDRAQLEQTLTNLAVNSRDAMPGGGRLTIEAAAVNFGQEYVSRHVGAQVGPHVMLAVSDTGTGMDADTQRQVFEPFFTTKEKGKGIGLGLSMVYGFVKQSGGTIYVYSEPGRGTTFKVYLPQAESPAGPDAGGQPAQAPGAGDYSGSETVLLAEDEDAVRKFVAHVLRRNGYTVLEACDARAAMPLGEHYEGAIDLLITDVVMPGLSGPDLAKRLSATRPDMPVLYLSGYTADAIAQHGVLADGVDLLSKPFGPLALGQAVRKVLDARQGNPAVG